MTTMGELYVVKTYIYSTLGKQIFLSSNNIIHAVYIICLVYFFCLYISKAATADNPIGLADDQCYTHVRDEHILVLSRGGSTLLPDV